MIEPADGDDSVVRPFSEREPRSEGSETPREIGSTLLLHEVHMQKVALELQNTELLQTREALERALARYIKFYDLSPAAFFTLETDGTLYELNLTAARFLGFERSRLTGRTLAQFIDPRDCPQFDACLRCVLNGDGDCVCEIRFKSASEGSRHMRLELMAIEDGTRCRVIGVDDSAQRDAERTLAREQQLLHEVIDASPNLIFVKDREGRFLLGNPALARCYGTSVDALVGKSDADFNSDADEVANFRRDDLEVIEGRVAKHIVEETVTFADGSVHFMTTSKVPLVDDAGHCDRLLGVATDITARKEAEAALYRADRLKNEFLAMLGHELRNPLVPIRNAARVIGRVGGGDPTLHWAHQMIERQVDHLARMVDDLLDVSRILEARIELKRARVAVDTFVGQAVETVRLITEPRQQTLSVSLPDEVLYVDVDVMRMTQVMVNLLRNSGKFTASGGHIEVHVRSCERDAAPGVMLTVKDDGMGIEPELLPHVFDLFTQEERALDRAEGGLGIGLALVRQVVSLHGGTVEARSGGPGDGAEFTIWLPCVADATRAEPQSVDPAGKAAECPSVRILLADDDAMVLESTAVVLRLEGHMVRAVADGAAALREVDEFTPQLALLDIGMGGMDGYEVVRRLRAHPHCAATLMVSLSGYGQASDRQRSAEAGFDRHLVKPVSLDLLLGLIAQVGTGDDAV